MEEMNKEVEVEVMDAYENAKKEASVLINDQNQTEALLAKASKKIKESKILKGLEEVPTLIQMIKAYLKGDFKEIPLGTIIAALAALIYWLSPIDIIPDVLPGLGYLDDIAVFAFCMRSIKTDLDAFKKWQQTQTDNHD